MALLRPIRATGVVTDAYGGCGSLSAGHTSHQQQRNQQAFHGAIPCRSSVWRVILSTRWRRCQTRIGCQAKATKAVEFFNILTSPELLAMTEALLPEHRERLYPPTVVLSMFMRQVLQADGSCQKAVNG